MIHDSAPRLLGRRGIHHLIAMDKGRMAFLGEYRLLLCYN
jgi:hypothetical protein